MQDKLYRYLQKNFERNEPIFISDIAVPNMSSNAVRQNLMKLTQSGVVSRYDTGVYYLPTETTFGKSTLSKEKVIGRRYISEKSGKLCGYISGYSLANKIGLTSQVPAVLEIVTNNVATQYRKVKVKGTEVVLRKPRVFVCEENCRALQFLDAVLEAEVYSELGRKETARVILDFAEKQEITLEDIDRYADYYPDRIYKALYEMEVFKNVYSSKYERF